MTAASHIGRRLLPSTLTLVLLLAAACSSGPSAAEWLAQARRADDTARGALARGAEGEAATALADFFDAPRSKDIAPDDARRVLQDVAFRCGELSLRPAGSVGDGAAALRWAERGLALGRADDLYVANLLVLAGQAHERSGDLRAAAAHYGDALRINELLLQRELGTDGGAR